MSRATSTLKEAGCEEHHLNEFDQEFLKRGVPCIRYADDIVLLAKSKRASERLLESSTKYLEERLKLTVNREKSRTVSVFAIRNFKLLGFALGRNGEGIYVRVHPNSWKKFKSRLKPRTKARNLIKMGVPEDLAVQAGNTRRGHWFATHTVAVNMAMTKERLINSGFYDLATAYQSVHVNY